MRQHTGGERDRDRVVARGPPQVLHHLAVRRAGEVDDRRHVAGVRAHQNDVRRLDRHVGPRADRDPHVGLGQRGCVVHAVAGHPYREAARLHLLDLRRLLIRQDLREVLIEGELVRDPPSHRFGVTREHHRSDPHGLEAPEGLTRLGPDDVCQRDGAFDPIVDQHVDNGLALRRHLSHA